MKQKTSPGIKPYFTIAMFALLVLATLALVLVGSRVYETLVKGQNNNAQNRVVRSYLYSQLRAGDRERGVAISKGPQGDAIVLREELETGTYEIRIYLYEGSLMEEYAVEGSEFAPERAYAVATTNSFEVEKLENNLLQIDTDAGTIYISLRSENGFMGGALS